MVYMSACVWFIANVCYNLRFSLYLFLEDQMKQRYSLYCRVDLKHSLTQIILMKFINDRISRKSILKILNCIEASPTVKYFESSLISELLNNLNIIEVLHNTFLRVKFYFN